MTLPPSNRRPRITVKYAQTLDGRIATSTLDGARRISGQESLQFAHELRAVHQAILVGVQTVVADDPLLTVRLAEGPNPTRIVLDSRLRIPLDAALLRDASSARTIVAHTSAANPSRADAIRQLGAETWLLRSDEMARVHIPALLAELWASGIETLMVEGGATVVTELLRQRLVDRLVICIALKIVGRGVDAIGDLGIRRVADACTLAHSSIRTLGEDIVVEGEPRFAAAAVVE